MTALLEKTERAFFLEQVYPSLVLLSLESTLPQLQVGVQGRNGIDLAAASVWLG